MPLLTKPLSPQERRAVTLRRQGMSTPEIADEMMITLGHAHTLLSRAKGKGAEFPFITARRQADVPIEKLVRTRAVLLAAGHPRYGMARVIAERTGLTPNCVKVRLWKYDHRQQGEQAA